MTRSRLSHRVATLMATALALTLVVSDDGVDESAFVISINEAHAVVGRPLTPVSYAGVARRTSRRVTRRNMYYGGAYGGAYAAPVAPAGYVTALPAGCGGLYGGVYRCGAVAYRPYYQGATVMYVPM